MRETDRSPEKDGRNIHEIAGFIQVLSISPAIVDLGELTGVNRVGYDEETLEFTVDASGAVVGDK